MGLHLMDTNKDETWKKILHIIITILTALATSLTTQSCMKHKSATPLPTREPIPVVTLASLPNQVTLENLPNQVTLASVPNQFTLENLPNQFALASLPNQVTLESDAQPIVGYAFTWLTRDEYVLLKQLLEHERECTMQHATELGQPPATPHS